MNMKRGLMILSLGAAVALGGFGSGQAFFNSPLAANSHYRPINFGMGYEMYVDLSSLETVKEAMEAMEEGLLADPEIIQLNVAKSKKLGRYHMMTGLNPIYIISDGGDTE